MTQRSQFAVLILAIGLPTLPLNARGQDPVAQLRTDVNKLRTDVNTLRGDSTTLRADTNTLRNDANTLRTDISKLASDASAQQARLAVLEQKLDATTIALTDIQNHLDANIDYRVSVLIQQRLLVEAAWGRIAGLPRMAAPAAAPGGWYAPGSVVGGGWVMAGPAPGVVVPPFGGCGSGR